jgi:hypothetical protein
MLLNVEFVKTKAIMTSTKRQQYNACYRLRKKGVKISTPEKTIYGSAELSEKPTVFLLLEKFSFVVQTQIFANEK